MGHYYNDVFAHWYFLLPFILLLITFVVFFYKAVKHTGTEQLKRFTEIMLITVAGINVFFFLKFDVLRFLPLRIIITVPIPFTLTFLFLAYYIFAFVFVRREKNTRFLLSVWMLFIAFNILDVILNTYRFLTWEKPIDVPTAKGILGLMDSFTNSVPPRETFIYHSMYPLFWVIVSCIGLIKINKEKLTQEPGTDDAQFFRH